MGLSDNCILYVDDLPEISGIEPGAITLSLLRFSIGNLISSQQKADVWALKLGSVAAPYASSYYYLISELIDTLETMADELTTGSITVKTPAETVVLSTDDLVILDRLIIAHFLGLFSEFGETMTASIAPYMSPITTEEGWADILRQTKDVGIPGIQFIGSYVSVVCGIAPFSPPLTLPAGIVSIISTAAITIGAASISIGLDALIDHIEGRDLDGYFYLSNAEEVIISGLRSILLAAASGLELGGNLLSAIVSLLNDSSDVINSFIEVMCASVDIPTGFN